jgi:hypothetical protein
MPHFLKLQTDLLNYASLDVDGDAKVMAQSAINRHYMSILRSIKQDVVMREFPFVTVADKSQYGLSPYIQDILNIDDPANLRRLVNLSSGHYDRAFPGNTDEGAPLFYYELKRAGVQVQPESAGVITVVSDNAADTTDFFVRFVGFDANGIMQSQKVTLTGLTSVSTTQSFAPAQGGIERIVKSTTGTSQVWSGTLTVTDDDGNVIARIPPMIESPTYLWIEFQKIPDAAYTYTIRAKSYRTPLVNDDDWPEIDDHFHDLLLYGPGEELLPNCGKPDLAAVFARKYRERLKEFKNKYAPRPNLMGQFADVTLYGSLPNRPLIPGYDIGLAR